MTKAISNQLPAPPSITSAEISRKAHDLLFEYIREVGEEHIESNGIDFAELYQSVLYPHYEIILDTNEDLGVTDSGDQIFGKFLPRENVVLIDKSFFLSNDPRKVFTLYHEVPGHGILHGSHLKRAGFQNGVFRTTEASIVDRENAYERQANLLASRLAAPLGFIAWLCRKLYGLTGKINYVGPGRYCIGSTIFSVHSPPHLAWLIAKQIRHYFGGLSTGALALNVLRVAVNRNGYTNSDFNSPDTLRIGATAEAVIKNGLTE